MANEHWEFKRLEASQPDGADDLGLDREARWQPDGAELVKRLPNCLGASMLGEHGGCACMYAALTAAQEDRLVVGRIAMSYKDERDASQERVKALKKVLDLVVGWDDGVLLEARTHTMMPPWLRQQVDKARVLSPQPAEPVCICPRFSDVPEGTIIADLTCPVHGVEGTQPGDVLSQPAEKLREEPPR